MKLVLSHDVPNVGKKHEVVTVKAGFGRNYLLPRGDATFLTKGLLKALETERAREDKKHAAIAAQAKELVTKLDGFVLQFRRKAAKGGKLYGSIARAAIAKAIKTELGIELPTSSVHLKESIRQTGTTKVAVHLGEGMEPIVTVRVAAE